MSGVPDPIARAFHEHANVVKVGLQNRGFPIEVPSDAWPLGKDGENASDTPRSFTCPSTKPYHAADIHSERTWTRLAFCEDKVARERRNLASSVQLSLQCPRNHVHDFVASLVITLSLDLPLSET